MPGPDGPSAAMSPDEHLACGMLIAAATAFVGVTEEGSNRGQVVELMLRGVNQQAGEPWCAAFVHHVGFWSQFDHLSNRSRWPLPATASCYQLGEFARHAGILFAEPEPGDVFLLYSSELLRFAHTGIVVSTQAVGAAGKAGKHECMTIEGNTNQAGEREGTHVLVKTREFSAARGDRFVRWIAIDKRLAA